MSMLSTLVHHGIVYVPLGYSHTFAEQSNLEEVHGGASPPPSSSHYYTVLILGYAQDRRGARAR